MTVVRYLGISIALFLLACSSDGPEEKTNLDTHTSDGRIATPDGDAADDTSIDATEPDAQGTDGQQRLDVVESQSDASARDASETIQGDDTSQAFGQITGECAALDEIDTNGDNYVENTIDFGANPYDESDKPLLTEGARTIISSGNAGGSSLLSEAFAYEVLHRCTGAALIATETEIEYTDSSSTKIDFLSNVEDSKLGTSVTRAVAFPHDSEYPVSKAKSLIRDKLSDLEASRTNVTEDDAWNQPVLQVIAFGDRHEDAVQTAFEQLSDETKASALVMVTVTDGEDGFLY